MRLIDADALNVYTIVRLVATGEQCENVIYAEDIDNAPTVDAVSVVHCKDCKWWNTDGYRECPNVLGETTADWYCANGERKENDG